MKKFVINSFIYSVRYKCTSYYGNPSYYVTFLAEDGATLRGHTASDALCGYSCENFVNKKCEITYHFTRGGSVIIDFIK